jgi:exodeoxyribonuclease VII large subunit
VSAVGHEQDTPLCDLAADARASTPTAAGRLVVPDARELHASLERARSGLERGTRRLLERESERVAAARSRLGRAPAAIVARERERLDRAHERLRRAPALALERKRASLDRTAGRLQTLSPRSTLERGYAIVRAGSRVVASRDDVSRGDEIRVDVADGAFGARVE